jgi:HK97 family phage portal protein
MNHRYDDAIQALDLMAKGIDPGQLTRPASPRGTFLDQFHTQENPSDNDLIREYREIVYACSVLNSQAVAATPLRLYVTTSPGQSKVRFWERRGVSTQTRNHLKSVPSLTARIGSDTELEEVVDHPLLLLLDSVNSLLDAFTLWELVDLYQEILGSAYLYVPKGRLGIPENIWVLPTQGVSVKRDRKKIIQKYTYRQGQEELDMDPEDVIPFHFPNLTDPYLGGWSPVRATYETLNIAGKSRSYRQAMLDNRVRPDAVMSPKEPIGGAEAVRLEKEINQKYRRGGVGGIMVVDENYTLQPLTLPLKDLEALSSEQISKETLANAFGVPMSLLTSTNVNRANAEAGHYQHAKLAVYPRCLRIQYRLNQRLVPLYDERLFLAFDNPVPEDTKIQVLVSKTDSATGDTTINERRAQRGLQPVAWGDYPSWEAYKADTSPEPEPQEPEESPEEPEEDDSNVKAIRVLFDYADGKTGRFEAETRLKALGYPDWNLNPVELPEPNLCCHDKNPEKHNPEWHTEKAQPHSRRLPEGHDLEDRLKTFFRWQRGQVLSRIKMYFENRTKISLDPVDLSSFAEEMRSRVAPLIEMLYDRYGREALTRVGATDMVDLWDVSVPEVRDAIKEQTIEFCRTTQRTTTFQINKAIEEVKEQLRLGILSGRNTPAELTRRVNGVFKHAEKYRAQRIALTESSRAVHRGQMLAAQKSGRVKGFRWLLSPDACEICQDIHSDQEEVTLGSNFAVRGSGPYSDIKHPPAHPNCMCTVTEVLYDLPS